MYHIPYDAFVLLANTRFTYVYQLLLFPFFAFTLFPRSRINPPELPPAQ